MKNRVYDIKIFVRFIYVIFLLLILKFLCIYFMYKEFSYVLNLIIGWDIGLVLLSLLEMELIV